MQSFITVKDALEEMGKGEPFDVTFWTADKSRDIGGEVKELKNVVISSKGIAHATRKVMLPNKEYREFHIYLMRSFNGKRIYV